MVITTPLLTMLDHRSFRRGCSIAGADDIGPSYLMMMAASIVSLDGAIRIVRNDVPARVGSGQHVIFSDGSRGIVSSDVSGRQLLDRCHDGVTFQCWHSREAIPPAECFAFDAPTLSKVASEVLIIVQRQWLWKVHPQPFSGHRSATCASWKRIGAPHGQRVGVHLTPVSADHYHAAHMRDDVQQSLMLIIAQLASINAVMLPASRDEVGWIQIDQRIVRNDVAGQPVKSISVQYRQIWRSEIRRPLRYNVGISVYADAGCRGPFQAHDSTATEERLNINAVRRHVAYNSLVDSSSAFTPWIGCHGHPHHSRRWVPAPIAKHVVADVRIATLSDGIRILSAFMAMHDRLSHKMAMVSRGKICSIV